MFDRALPINIAPCWSLFVQPGLARFQAQLTPDARQNIIQQFITQDVQFNIAVILLQQWNLGQRALRKELAKLVAKKRLSMLEQ